MVGYKFCEKLLAKSTDFNLVVFGEEPRVAYDRVHLSEYFGGKTADDLLMAPTRWYHDNGITLHLGDAVQEIDRASQTVHSRGGLVQPYDYLVLATGSSAFVPDVPGVEKKGVMVYRTIEDLDEIKAYAATARSGAVLGGGLLGLEMAASLRALGLRVLVVQRSARFLDRQLDELGSQFLREEMERQGCDLYFNDEVRQYYGHSRLTSVSLKSGRQLPCDALLLAIGTTPNVELARAAGLAGGRGVEVDAHLQTSDPSVYALGEIAEFEGLLYGITAAAEQQATVLARYLSGDVAACYQGSTLMNIIKISGFDLCSIGLSEAPDYVDYEEVIMLDRARRTYKKCLVYQDRLVGAILIGDKSEFREFRELIANKTELGSKRAQLLRGGSAAAPVLGKLVCSCNGVGTDNLHQAITGGCDSLKQLCATTGAGTGCGSCRPEVQRLLEASLVAG